MPKLTKQFVDRCKTPAGSAEKTFWDNDLSGFGLRVRPSGRKSFILQYRNAHGRERKMTLGRYGALTPQEARLEAKRVLGQVAAGTDPAEEKQASRSAETIADLCDEHLEANNGRIKASTWKMDESRIEQHIKPLLGTRTVQSLTPKDVEKLLTDITAGKSAKSKNGGRGGRTKGGPGVARRSVSMLGTILERAVRDGLIERNPARGIALPKDKPRKPPFSFRLVGQLGEALREGKVARLNDCALDAISLLFLSGCRRQEVLGLRWEEVDFEAQCLRLADTKSGPQARPVGRAALDVLAKRERESNFVFPSTKSSGHYVGLPRIWSAVSARAQLNGMTLHGLRHWYASAAAEMNFSELTIAGLLGHSVRGVTARYATTPDSALKAAANEISKKLAEALNGSGS